MSLKSFLFENTSVRQTIVKNTIWLFSGQILSRLLRAVIVIYATRVLGPASWGAFSYALGIATFLTAFSDIGINALITKEGARDPALRDRYVGTALYVKLGLLLVLGAGAFALTPYITAISEARTLLPILLFVFAFDTLRDLGSAVARAMEKMQFEALFQIGTNLVIAILGFLFLFSGGSSLSLAYAYALGSAAGCIALYFTLSGHLGRITRSFDRSLISTIFKRAWPFGLLSLMGVIMLNTDIVILGWLRSPEEVGYYSAAQKLVALLYVLPSLIATSTFPVLSRLVKSTPDRAKAFLEKTVLSVAGFGLFVALLGVPLGWIVIPLLYGVEYVPAVLSFQLLVGTVVFVFPSTILGNAVFAYDQEKKFLRFVLISAVMNAVLDFIFIPPLGIEGAALATVIVQVVMNLLMFRAVRRSSGIFSSRGGASSPQ